MIGTLAVVALGAAAEPAPIEATSLAGAPLTRPTLPDDFRATQEALLAEAEAALASAPKDADALIWKGRRLGYLGRYKEAIALFERGAARHPDDARFLRHLGHRLITTRKLDAAIDTLSEAAALVSSSADEVEPDGLPNDRGIPTSTLKGNIHYHLALAHYLKGDFERAGAAFGAAAALAANADSAVASRYWLYLSRERAGDNEGADEALAPVSADWDVIENKTYHQLTLCFKGEADCGALLAEARDATGVASSTVLYGIAAKALIDGDESGARSLMKEIVAQEDWASFGHIAAEADLAANRVGR